MRFLKLVDNPKRIMVYIKDPEKKNIILIIKELLILTIKKREIPYYYFKHLYKKEVTNILDYLGTKERARIHSDTNLQKYELTSILQNKLNFAIYCEKYNLKSPLAIGHNFSNRFVFQGKIKKIETIDDLTHHYTQIFEQENLTELFIKPLAFLGGKGCFKLTLKNLNEKLKEEKKSLLSGNYIHTKVLKQHQKINEIHPHSINTLRLLTYITDEGNTEMVSALMRFGIDENIVDNSSNGGFFIGIDMNYGHLNATGWTKSQFGGRKITHHPNSNYKLSGFKVPFFKEACDMVIEYTKYIPNRLIGWDVAITPYGPVVIEGNHDPNLVGSDVAVEGLLKNKHIKKLVNQVNQKK